MIPSPGCLAYMRRTETLKLRAYMPTKNDRPTIGYGATFRADGSPVEMGDTITAEQAALDFAHRVNLLAAQVLSLLDGKPTTQEQFDAMVCLSDNIGVGAKGFAGSSVLKLHKAGNYAAAASRFAPWKLQDGIVLGGLVTRRGIEASVYKGGKWP